MCATVFGASFGYVSNSNVPFSVSTTTIDGPAPGDVFAEVCLPSVALAKEGANAVLAKTRQTIPSNRAVITPRIHRPASVLSPRHEIQIDQRPPALRKQLI